MGVRPEWSNRWNELLLPSRADLRIFREWKKARDIEEAQDLIAGLRKDMAEENLRFLSASK